MSFEEEKDTGRTKRSLTRFLLTTFYHIVNACLQILSRTFCKIKTTKSWLLVTEFFVVEIPLFRITHLACSTNITHLLVLVNIDTQLSLSVNFAQSQFHISLPNLIFAQIQASYGPIQYVQYRGGPTTYLYSKGGPNSNIGFIRPPSVHTIWRWTNNLYIF